jgi:predicted DNA-binding transcriptional regulator AlpA
MATPGGRAEVRGGRLGQSAPTARPGASGASGDVSRFLGIPVNTLYQWRHHGVGPRAYRVGRHLRYDPAEIRRWLAEGAA